jgi:hypothetical protein
MNKTGTGRIVCKVELANKIESGRAVGNLYGVAEYDHDGTRRLGYILQPQADERAACILADAANADLPDAIWVTMAQHYGSHSTVRRRYTAELDARYEVAR